MRTKRRTRKKEHTVPKPEPQGTVQIIVEETTEQKEEEDTERYQHVQTNHKIPADVTLGMPTFVNTNSNEGVSLVLRHIDMNGGITRYEGKDRQWMFACSDGRPCSLYQRILDEVMI